MAKKQHILMKLNRNKTVASTLGHIITFVKGVPTPVPEIMVRSCAEIGAERVDGADAFAEEEKKVPANPVDPGQRLSEIGAALETIIERNDIDDFTAAGIPNVRAVGAEVGYKVDRTEVLSAWKARSEED